MNLQIVYYCVILEMNKKKTKRSAVFLDRDGVINYDYGYVYEFKNFKIKKGVISGLKYLLRKKYLLFIVTNQSGIARGIFTEKEYLKFTSEIRLFFRKKNIFFRKISYCPFHPNAKIKKYRKNSKFRKPGNLMIEEIKKNWGIDNMKSFMIGDNKKDMMAAKKSKIYFEYAKNDFCKQVKLIDQNL